MKKIVSLLLVFTLVIGLCACGGNKETNTDSKTDNKTDSKKSGGTTKIVFWGLNPESIGSGNKEMIADFK